MTYTRENVEGLLGAIWDEDFAWGVLNERAPDPDMPKASVDKSHGSTLYAMLADIRQAWRFTSLSADERMALQLRVRFGRTTREAGKLVGVSHVSIAERYDEGVGKLMRWLNGDDHEYDSTQA